MLAYDPEATKVAKGIFGDRITYASTNYDAIKGADGAGDRHRMERVPRPDFARMKSLMKTRRSSSMGAICSRPNR